MSSTATKSHAVGGVRIHVNRSDDKRQNQQAAIDFDSLPIIDRVPTAIGYQSSFSEEDTNDGSRSSRYRTWEHEVELGKENDGDDYDYISATDDRYSIFDDLESLSSSSSVHDSITSIESKIGKELHHQRESFRDNMIRLTESADLAIAVEARDAFSRLEYCFSTKEHGILAWESPRSSIDNGY